MSTSNDIFEHATQFWNKEVTNPTHKSWLENLDVRVYANEMISGPERLWPIDWFHARIAHGSYHRGLSVGCGTGALERDLVKRGLVVQVDAFDGSETSIREAKRLAETDGLNINYFVEDFNSIQLPRETYDIVFFHQSMHHVAELERLLGQVLRTLRPTGVLYLDEYVGPSRTDWTNRKLAVHRAIFERLPAEWKLVPELAFPIQGDDPSEAIRSGEIIAQVRSGFEIRESRPYGGTLLSVLYPVINWDVAPATLLETLIAFERDLLANGEETYYGVYVAVPKRGAKRHLATLRYCLKPRLASFVRAATRLRERFALSR